jgi:hypothetical protein
MCDKKETVDQFLARGGVIQHVPKEIKAKRTKRDYGNVTLCVARTTEIHYQDGSKIVASDNPLSKKGRYQQQREIAKNKGNYSLMSIYKRI